MRPWTALLLPAVLLTAACGDTPAERLTQAREAFAGADYQGARVSLAAALREEPGNGEMLLLLARTQLRLRDADGAETSIAALARKGGDPAELARLRAEVLLLRDRPREALDALPASDGSPEAWRLRAAAWLAQDDEANARAAFAQGMAAGPDVQLATEYARHLLRAGEIAATAEVYQAMRRFAPRAYDTLVLEGDLAAARGQEAAAIAAYRRASARYSQRYEPLLALANQLDAQGKVKEAMALADRAETLAGDRPEIFELQIQLLGELGEWEKVRSYLQGRESTLDPTSSLGLTYGEALLRLGHPEQARVLFRRALLRLPGNPYSTLMLGEAELATKDAQAAWKTLEPLSHSALAPPEVLDAAARAAEAAGAPEAAALRARLDPVQVKRNAALVAKAQTAFERQDWTAAIAAYQAIPGGEGDPDVLMRLALASSRLGRHGEAVAAADRVVALFPQRADCLRVAGLVRLAAGDAKLARAFLQRAVEADPHNGELRRDLKKAQAAG
jgi:tetratricopeptide (TPR) repeat protein